jgi:hypothetical protein
MAVNKREREQPPPETGKPPPLVQSHGGDNAPMVYFDGAVAYGVIGAVVQLELAANIVIPVAVNGHGEIRTRSIVTAHLRGSHAAMAQLADAIEKALMITGPLDRNAMPEPIKESAKKVRVE